MDAFQSQPVLREDKNQVRELERGSHKSSRRPCLSFGADAMVPREELVGESKEIDSVKHKEHQKEIWVW